MSAPRYANHTGTWPYTVSSTGSPANTVMIYDCFTLDETVEVRGVALADYWWHHSGSQVFGGTLHVRLYDSSRSLVASTAATVGAAGGTVPFTETAQNTAFFPRVTLTPGVYFLVVDGLGGLRPTDCDLARANPATTTAVTSPIVHDTIASGMVAHSSGLYTTADITGSDPATYLPGGSNFVFTTFSDNTAFTSCCTALIGPDTDLPCTEVELRVYERDAVTLRGVVAGVGAQFTDPLGEVGAGAFNAPVLQAVMQTNPDFLEDGIVKVATNLVPDGSLVEIFGFLSEGGEWQVITDTEDAGKGRGIQGRGLLALLDDAVVYPEGGFRDKAADSRVFGWMSVGSAHWYDVTDWDGTISGTRWKDVSDTADRYQKPKGWTDKNAYWVGMGPTHPRQYLRSNIHVDDDTPVRIEASADENLRVYLDSQLIIKNNSDEVGYTELNHWRGVLSAGDHTIGVHFLQDHSYAAWGLGYDLSDRDRAIVTCYTINQNGDYASLLRHTNPTSGKWVGVALDNDGSRPPTWHAGGIIGQLVDEAIARDVDSMSRITLGFTDTHDTDSVAWTDLQEKSWAVGTKYTQVATDLGEHDVDWDMLPDLTLNGYMSQGSDKTGLVAIEQGVNITSLKATVTPPVATTLLTRSKSRWVEVSDTDAETAGDRVEGFLQTGNSVSKEQATHHATVAVNHYSHKRLHYTCEFIAVDGCVPYLDFGKGDLILSPNRAGALTSMRVLSLSGSMPDDGPIRWTAELAVDAS